MTPAISFAGVTVRYRASDAPALLDLDLTIHPGERVALVGPSGAGKSTLIGLSNGLVLPTSGSVTVLGVPTEELARRRHRATRAQIGTVHQQFALVGALRVAHNVAAGRLGSWGGWEAVRSLVRPRDLDEIRAALDAVGIGDKLWARTQELSGGQQQRVAIARLLFQRPSLALVDEPVSSLDPTNSVAMLEVLADPLAGSLGAHCSGDDARPTLLASLHDAPLARSHFDRVIGLRSGNVAFDRLAADVTADDLDELYVLER